MGKISASYTAARLRAREECRSPYREAGLRAAHSAMGRPKGNRKRHSGWRGSKKTKYGAW